VRVYLLQWQSNAAMNNII